MSKEVRIGELIIGGGHPIAIQSMTNVSSKDEKALLRQIHELEDHGCHLVRVAIPDMEAVRTFKAVKHKLLATGHRIPLICDIHFDYRLAVESIKNGADKIRTNPGNIGSSEKLREVVKCAKERQIPIRVGVNSGSLEKELLLKYGGVTPEALCESGLKSLKLIEEMDYDNLVISVKSSNVKLNHKAHKLLVKEMDYPVHIGITESGTMRMGKTKSAIGIGGLLLEGIGDTMRVSLTADPVYEVEFAKDILRALDLQPFTVDLVSCPTCGRTQIELEKLAREVQEKTAHLSEILKRKNINKLKIAVMGCVVNGPGEAREADFGIAGGKGQGIIFKKGVIIKKTSEANLVRELMQIIEEDLCKD